LGIQVLIPSALSISFIRETFFQHERLASLDLRDRSPEKSMSEISFLVLKWRKNLMRLHPLSSSVKCFSFCRWFPFCFSLSRSHPHSMHLQDCLDLINFLSLSHECIRILLPLTEWLKSLSSFCFLHPSSSSSLTQVLSFALSPVSIVFGIVRDITRRTSLLYLHKMKKRI
jgi:hypothetical protein